jgi:tetratricopeptide (TPR) repeat protein
MKCSLRSSWRMGLVVLAFLVAGCTAARKDVASSSSRNPLQAVEANEEGLKHVKNGQFEQAEGCFRKAITADLFYAPAHNNLGLVLLEQKKYYEAACEFEYAAKLAPRSAEPRANLGLLFEAVGRWQEAEGQYEQALAVEPQNFAVMGHRILRRANSIDPANHLGKLGIVRVNRQRLALGSQICALRDRHRRPRGWASCGVFQGRRDCGVGTFRLGYPATILATRPRLVAGIGQPRPEQRRICLAMEKQPQERILLLKPKTPDRTTGKAAELFRKR